MTSKRKIRKTLTLTAGAILGVVLLTASSAQAMTCTATLEITPNNGPLVIVAETDSHRASAVEIHSWPSGGQRARIQLRASADGQSGFGLLYGGVADGEVLVARFIDRRGGQVCLADVDLSALETPADEHPGEGGF